MAGGSRSGFRVASRSAVGDPNDRDPLRRSGHASSVAGVADTLNDIVVLSARLLFLSHRLADDCEGCR